MHKTRRENRATRPPVRSSRFTADPDGFFAHRDARKKPLAESTVKKWRPRIEELEALRIELFEFRQWPEIDPEDIAFRLMEEVFARCRGRGGGEPSTNTLRGRYDAANAYFDFLQLIGALPHGVQPLDHLARPSSRPNTQPSLEEDEDLKIAALELEGTEQAVYTLSRSNLREGEICDLDDCDVDLENGVIIIRDGKTRKALRRVPLYPEAVRRLREYRSWRDENVRAKSSRFVRTRSGKISAGYVWKLIKAIGVRAAVRLVDVPPAEVEPADPDAAPEHRTEITPHTLRRTWGADLARRDIPTAVFSKTMGHSSKRVTEESYALISEETATRKILLAAGGGPFSLAGGVDGLEQQLAEIQKGDPVDVAGMLQRLEALRCATETTIRTLSAYAPQPAPTLEASEGRTG